MPSNIQSVFLDWFFKEVFDIKLAEDIAYEKTLEENKGLKLKVEQLELELFNQKRMTTHFEGLAFIMMAEMKKVQSVELLSKNVRLSVLLGEFFDEMKGFLEDKNQIMQRFSKIENVYHCIVSVLNGIKM